MHIDGLTAGGNLAVEQPEIRVVLDTVSGFECPVGEVIGHDRDRLMQLRLEVKTSNQEDRAKYLCAECFVPVYLVSTRATRRFFFRHMKEDHSCSAVTRGKLNQDEIDARKYNGAKESFQHRQMKSWLMESLQASGMFTGIVPEQRWTGPVTRVWRRPDVSAMYGELQVAFEVQLSTTYLDVIAARRSFYLKEGGLLFWVFAKFEETGRRLTLDDVFYNNNQNAFVVSEETRDASRTAGKSLFDCIWAEPDYGNSLTELRRERVSFEQLTIDLNKQQAFFYDYSAAKNQPIAEQEEERISWPTRFESWWLELASRHTSLYDQQNELRDFPQCVPRDWSDWGMMKLTPLHMYDKDLNLPVAMLDCFYSAKHGRPIGLNRRHFIEVAHYLAASYPKYLRWFRRALKVYERASLLKEQDKKGNWSKRVREYTQDMRVNPSKYASELKHQLLFEFLFPELGPLSDAST